MPGTGPSVDPTALTVIAAAVRGRMRIAQRDAVNDLRMRLANTPATIHSGQPQPTCVRREPSAAADYLRSAGLSGSD